MKGKRIILSATYFPPIQYFVCFLKDHSIVIDAFENYQKQTYRNRFEIYSPNGRQALNVPVHKTFGNHTPVNEVLIQEPSSFWIKHWKAIETAYHSSPFLLYYQDEILEILQRKHKKLFQLNSELLKLLLELIGIGVNYKYSEKYIEATDYDIDLRDVLHPKKNDYKTNEYYQVFTDKYGFLSNLSILDLLFNLGPETYTYLKNLGYTKCKHFIN